LLLLNISIVVPLREPDFELRSIVLHAVLTERKLAFSCEELNWWRTCFVFMLFQCQTTGNV